MIDSGVMGAALGTGVETPLAITLFASAGLISRNGSCRTCANSYSMTRLSGGRRKRSPYDLPPLAADTKPARRELARVEGDLVRVVDAIAKIGFSAALESKLAELEARKHTLLADLQAAERTIQLPDISAITAKWRAGVEDLGNLPKMATPPEV